MEDMEACEDAMRASQAADRHLAPLLAEQRRLLRDIERVHKRLAADEDLLVWIPPHCLAAQLCEKGGSLPA